MFGPAPLLLLAVLSGMVSSFPVQEPQIYFPGDAEIQATNGEQQAAFDIPKTEQRMQYVREHYPSEGGHQSMQWSGSPSGSSYGSSRHRVSYSSYGPHSSGHRLTYSSHSGSYGSGSIGQQPGSASSYGSTHHHTVLGGASEGHSQHQPHQNVDWTSHSERENGGGQHPGSASSYSSTHHHTVVSETSEGHNEHQPHQNVDWTSHSERENGGGHGYFERKKEETMTQHRPERIVEQQQVEDQIPQIISGAHNQRPADTAAAEHHIIEEMKELVGVTSSPSASTIDPIAQQQQIIREMNELAEPSPKPITNGPNQKTRRDFQGNLSHVNYEAESSPLGHSTNTHVREEASYVRPAQTIHEQNREEIVESPALKGTSHYGTLGGGHRTIHTETREESSHLSHSARSTPDPLDLANLLDAYKHGEFGHGSGRTSTPQPQKELDPEIKQAIDNIMKEWEVMPDREGKPVPPTRNIKVTKHVKVTQTTHNGPVVHIPGHTVTKVTRTETVHPSSSIHRKVIRHHVNIAELLEQLRHIENSNPHRNITWCEEKIKEFLTELNRKEESGIEINQSAQEETLHHILTQDHTITKEVHHEVGHDADGGVVEEPYVKKTVVGLGLNEPTRPPSHWTEEQTVQETHTVTGGETKPDETNVEGSSVNEVVEETKDTQPGEVNYGHEQQVEQTYIPPETPKIDEEQQIFTEVPNQDHVPPLESLSHQTHNHTSSEIITPQEKEEEIIDEAREEEHHNNEDVSATVPPKIPEIPAQPDIDEFKGETEVQHRPLPPNYKPREESEEKEEEEVHQETPGNVIPDEEPKENSQVTQQEEKKEEHNSIEDLSVDLPFYNETAAQTEVKTEQEQEAGGRDTAVDSTAIQSQEEHENTGGQEQAGERDTAVDSTVIQTKEEHEHAGGHYAGGYEVVNQEEGAGGSSHHETVEHVIHELNGHGHSGGSTNTEYTEETVEHHSGGGGDHVNTEINYDQLIEELISLESLPGHQAIDKCDEKIRQFLEVLKRQQERGFDENKLELERLRRLIEEMQAQRRNQQEQNSIPQSTEAPSSFWKKVGRKIKATIQKAKTKANDILNTEEH